MSQPRSNDSLAISKEFIKCVDKGHYQRVNELLHLYPWLLHITNNLGQEPIHIAAKNGCAELVKIFICYPIDINRLSADGKAPLHFAIESGNYETVSLITNVAAINLNICTYSPKLEYAHGMTPIFMASHLNQANISILKLLLEKGANAGIATVNGQTPLTVAIWWNHKERIKLLLSTNKVNVNSIMTSGGHTALTNAIAKSDAETVRDILAVSDIKTINHKKSNGESALFMAVSQGDVDKVKLLLTVPGIDIAANRVPGDGKSIIEIAQEKKYTEIVQLLRSIQIKRLENETNKLQVKMPFETYAKNLRKMPTDDLYFQYLKDLKEAHEKNITITLTEKKYVQSRKTWSDMISDCDRRNEDYIKTHQVKESVKSRLKILGATGDLEKIYQDCIDYIKYNSVIVLTISLEFLKNTGLKDYQPLNIFERDTKGAEYVKKRDLVEKEHFKFINSKIQTELFNNIHARPRYAALVLLDKNHSIEPISYYGKSCFVLDNIIKFNCLYNPNDGYDSKMVLNQELIPCTYHHLELLLFQCQNFLLKALLQRVVTGQLPPGYSQQYISNARKGGYVEVMIPPLNLLDPKITKSIFINPIEYQLKLEEIAAIDDLGIEVTNSVHNPYPLLQSEFIQCVENNKFDRTRELLKSHPWLLHTTNNLGQEPIHIAAKNGCAELVKFFIRYPIDINRLSADGKAPLHFAIESGNYETVSLITNVAAINLNICTYSPKLEYAHGMTPVFMASYLNQANISILKLLIEKGANAGIATVNGQTPLTVAIWWNHKERIKLLSSTNKVNVNSIMTSGGHTALTNAIEKSDTETVRDILAVSDIKTINHKKSNGESALFMAVSQGDVDKVKLLLTVPGIDIAANRVPGDGKSIIEIAQENKSTEMIKLNIKPFLQIFITNEITAIRLRIESDQNPKTEFWDKLLGWINPNNTNDIPTTQEVDTIGHKSIKIYQMQTVLYWLQRQSTVSEPTLNHVKLLVHSICALKRKVYTIKSISQKKFEKIFSIGSEPILNENDLKSLNSENDVATLCQTINEKLQNINTGQFKMQ